LLLIALPPEVVTLSLYGVLLLSSSPFADHRVKKMPGLSGDAPE
jgi:hypothetical protein